VTVIAVIGKGNVGGGLGNLWEESGHDVARIGREGGDVSDADAVLLAVPGGAVADALDNVQGIEGKIVMDATNLVGVGPPAGFSSNAEFVKSRTNGPRSSRSTSTSHPSTVAFATLDPRRAICGAATTRPGRSSSS
jgi:predicted dinucleotide-binding enzyme